MFDNEHLAAISNKGMEVLISLRLEMTRYIMNRPIKMRTTATM